MNTRKRIKRKELTIATLESMNPFDVVTFYTGECLASEWMESKGVKGRLSFCPKRRYFMFYFSEKESINDK